MRWKKILGILIVFGAQLLLFVPVNAEAVNLVEARNLPSVLSPQEILEEQERCVDLGEIERFLQEVDREIGDFFPAGSLKQFIAKFAAGEIDLAPQEMFRQIIVYFWREVIMNLSLLGKLLLVAVVCAILSILQSAFEQGTVAKVA
jgi:stage III sporulation protein AE